MSDLSPEEKIALFRSRRREPISLDEFDVALTPRAEQPDPWSTLYVGGAVGTLDALVVQIGEHAFDAAPGAMALNLSITFSHRSKWLRRDIEGLFAELVVALYDGIISPETVALSDHCENDLHFIAASHIVGVSEFVGLLAAAVTVESSTRPTHQPGREDRRN